MEVYNSRYQTLTYHAQDNLLVQSWTKETERMTDAENRIQMLSMLDAIKNHHPKSLLVDSKEFLYAISPEMQEWVNRNIFMVKTTVKKVAIVLSKEFFSRLSVKQALTEERPPFFQNRFFDEYEEAHKWVLDV